MARRGTNAQHDYWLNGGIVASLNTLITGDDAVDYPRVKIKDLPGWDSIPDFDELTPDLPVGVRGEYPQLGTSRGKTQTYNLKIQALNENDLTSHRALLRSAFADRSTQGLIVATPWPVYGEDVWATFARVSAYDGDDRQERTATAVPSPWQREPVLSFRQKDGRWYWWNESGVWGQRMSWTNTSGGVVVNSGGAPADPIITIAGVGAGTDVHVARDIAGGGTLDLWFRQPGAGTLVIDFAHPRTARIGLTDVMDSLDENESTWWDPFAEGVPPGSHNIWRGPGAGTSIKVEFFSADW